MTIRIIDLISICAGGLNLAGLVRGLSLRRSSYSLGLGRGMLEGRIAAHRAMAPLLPEEVVCLLKIAEASTRDLFAEMDATSPRWMRAANAELQNTLDAD